MFFRKPFFRKFNKKPVTRINEQIKASEVRVIDEKGQNLGVLKTEEAIRIAKERGFDLVEISDKVQPSICKIIDYGKYKYAQEKKERKQKAHQKTGETKCIRIGFTTSSHDLGIRINQIEKFFKEGHKVMVEMRLKGREKAHFDLAKEKLESFLSTIPGEIKKEEEIKKSPQGFTVTICQGKPENQSLKDSK